jgi:hypothetical protein
VAALPALPDVRVTPRLLNASLAVLCAYASLEMVHETPRTVFAQEDAKDADMFAPDRNGQLDEALARLRAFVTRYPQEGAEKGSRQDGPAGRGARTPVRLRHTLPSLRRACTAAREELLPTSC